MTQGILITGANRGIGLELATQYAGLGWRVYATCRQPEAAHELIELSARQPERVSIHPLNVANDRQISALAQALRGESIDMLFNNAGVYGPEAQEFGSVVGDEWIEAFRINSIAPLKLMQAFVEHVAASRLRLMVGMTSKMGSMADNGSGGYYVYRASKAALNAVLKSAAIDLKPRGITVLVLHPGWVKTEMGGPNALISPAECVTKLRAILDRATPADSGMFYQVDGSVVPW